MKTIAIVALLGQVLATSTDAPLVPSGKWTVDYANAGCILSRDYGTMPAVTSIGFNPFPLGDTLEVITVSPGIPAKRYQKLKGTLTLQPSGETFQSEVTVYGIAARNNTLTTLNAEGDIAAKLLRSTSISIALADGTRKSFAVPGMPGAAAALRACQDDLLKSWGIDPTERDRVPTPKPRTEIATWLSTDDYPSEAMASHSEGTSVIVWTIQPNGLIGDCRIVQSSGSKPLDDTACRAFKKRGRYAAVIDRDGKPATAHAMRKVVWRLP
ncbi:MAG: energy transducer TonB [Pseudomonadota bacterium]|jgi:TonB family protein